MKPKPLPSSPDPKHPPSLSLSCPPHIVPRSTMQQALVSGEREARGRAGSGMEDSGWRPVGGYELPVHPQGRRVE